MKLTSILPQIKTDNKIQKSGNAMLESSVSKSTSLGGDKVEFSSGSRDVMKMQEILQGTPEVREDKVNSLKKQIEQGTYQVDSHKIADKMLWNLLSD